MQLLVSVRDAAEARRALAAGADILDAKDPALGALAPVSPDSLADIAALATAGVRWSAALGEPTDAAALAALLAERADALVRQPAFLKFVPPPARTGALLAMVACARAAAPTARIIVAGYADRLGGTALPDLARGARSAGGDGVLVDTATKGTTLFAHASAEQLEAFAAVAHELGLLVAFAGGLGLDDFGRAARLGADVVGVRGAACDGGRMGRLSEQRVALLVQAARRARRGPTVPVS